MPTFGLSVNRHVITAVTPVVLPYGRLTLRLIAVTLGWLVWAGCRSAPPYSFDRQLGVVAAGCMTGGNASLALGSTVQLINPMRPQTHTSATLAPPDETCKGFRLSTPPDPAPQIAIAGYAGAFASEGDLLAADLDGDGKKEYFRACTSSEGVHLTVWTGRPLTGVRRWHQYHYLGYDVDPDCRPEDTAGTK
jgi:hypothetical protein